MSKAKPNYRNSIILIKVSLKWRSSSAARTNQRLTTKKTKEITASTHQSASLSNSILNLGFSRNFPHPMITFTHPSTQLNYLDSQQKMKNFSSNLLTLEKFTRTKKITTSHLSQHMDNQSDTNHSMKSPLECF